MRIIVVNDYGSANGGASVVALSSLLGLKDKGLDVALFCGMGPVDERLTARGIKVYSCGQYDLKTNPNRLSAAVTGLWNGRSAARLTELLSTYDPAETIVHAHTWGKVLSPSVLKTISDRGFPCVITMHDYSLACPNSGFFNYRSNSPCKLTPLSRACAASNCDKAGYSHKVWRLLRQWCQQTLAGVPHTCKHFISVSDFSKQILSRFLPTDATIHEVRNPIMIERSSRIDAWHNRRYMYLGRLSPEKGCHLLAGAAFNAGAHATFVGDGECRQELESNYPDAEFTGWQSSERVREWLSKARAVVLPSLWYETQGLIIQEAAAIGVPSVVPTNTAAAEFVRDGITGLIFENGNVADLENKIGALHDDAFVRQLGENAYREYWQAPATLENHVDSLITVYSDMLGIESKTSNDAPNYLEVIEEGVVL